MHLLLQPCDGKAHSSNCSSNPQRKTQKLLLFQSLQIKKNPGQMGFNSNTVLNGIILLVINKHTEKMQLQLCARAMESNQTLAVCSAVQQSKHLGWERSGIASFPLVFQEAKLYSFYHRIYLPKKVRQSFFSHEVQ